MTKISHSESPYSWLESSLTSIHRADWYRSVQSVQGMAGATVQLDGHEVINFASNDYLGLASDKRLIAAAIQATEELGTGSTGSRLLSGHRELHQQLENAIASWKQTPDAVVFSSGYLANIGTIAALVGKRDLVLSDQYNHSSLKNGAILSGANIIEYSHCNIQNLQNHLHQQRHLHRRTLIITDSVFSMDGDLCPLPELLDLATQFNCMLLIDEAHATGIFGKNGAGTVAHWNCTGQELIQMGTLSKALGSLGGYVTGSKPLIDFLRNRASSWIYTTALSPADTAAALTAIKILQQEPQHKAQLWHNVSYLKDRIHEVKGSPVVSQQGLFDQHLHNLKLLPSQSPILCIQLENATKAIEVGKYLKQSGIFAPAIRPPTVPTSRIRISVMATHQQIHLDKLLEVLEQVSNYTKNG